MKGERAFCGWGMKGDPRGGDVVWSPECLPCPPFYLHPIPVHDVIQPVLVINPVVEGEDVGLAVGTAEDLHLGGGVKGKT